MPGQNSPVARGGAPVDFQVGKSEDEMTLYQHDDDEDRAAPNWDSEEELSDLDPWLGDSSEEGTNGLKLPTLEGEGERYLPLRIP